MEKLAHDIANKIAVYLDFDDNKESVIAYGLTAIIQIITLLSIITIIGLIFDFWYESFIIFVTVGIIRKSTGGAHSETMYGCILISVLNIVILSSLSRYILNHPLNLFINLSISIFLYILCAFTFYKLVPIASPKKPITNPIKIKRLRNQSYITITVFFIISVVFVLLAEKNARFYSIAFSIRLAMLWQVFTLTSLGTTFINKIDLKFRTVND